MKAAKAMKAVPAVPAVPETDMRRLEREGWQRHVMPNLSEVYYRPRDHSYWRGVNINPRKPNEDIRGQGRLAGVTTAVAPLDFRPDALLDWACRQEHHGVALLAAEGLSLEEPDDMRAALRWLTSADSIRQALLEGELLHTDARDRAGARGTNVHKHALAALAFGAPVPRMKAMTVEERGFARGVMAFWHEHEPEVTHSEQVVWSDPLGVAGRFDLRYRDEIGTVLLDCKTSGYISAKAHGQVALYESLAVQSGIKPSDTRLILQVDVEGGYELLPVRCSPAQALYAVATYRAAGEINRLAAKDRRARDDKAA